MLLLKLTYGNLYGKGSFKTCATCISFLMFGKVTWLNIFKDMWQDSHLHLWDNGKKNKALLQKPKI